MGKLQHKHDAAFVKIKRLIFPPGIVDFDRPGHMSLTEQFAPYSVIKES